jgi:hypothetical protein
MNWKDTKMSDDLVKRLRSVDISWNEAGEYCAEAADLIEVLDKACKEWAEVSQRSYQRGKAAEAKLAKVVEAMQEAIKLADMPHYGDREDALDNCFDAIVLLRTTLSELNGDKT